jgi:hypothetical protein
MEGHLSLKPNKGPKKTYKVFSSPHNSIILKKPREAPPKEVALSLSYSLNFSSYNSAKTDLGFRVPMVRRLAAC